VIDRQAMQRWRDELWRFECAIDDARTDLADADGLTSPAQLAELKRIAADLIDAATGLRRVSDRL
jgi:hypothetical protein